MGFLDSLTKFGATLVEQAQKAQARQMKELSARIVAKGGPEPRIGGKTLRQWEGSWQRLGMLSSTNLRQYSNYVGLYRASLNGNIVYVGRAVKYLNGGLRKRLSDYTRESDSSRKHASGQLMNQHATDLTIDILITGSDEAAVATAKKLEIYFIGEYSPSWNKMHKQ